MTRERAIQILKMNEQEKWRSGITAEEEKEAFDMAIEALKDRPHGEWEFCGDNLFKCTHCGYIANGDYLRNWKAHTYDAEFPTSCLKCGADMRKEGDEK